MRQLQIAGLDASFAMLRYINNILTVGMVPALFGDDEKEPLVGAIRARPGELQVVASLRSGLWLIRGFSNHCDTFGNPPYEENGLWEFG